MPLISAKSHRAEPPTDRPVDFGDSSPVSWLAAARSRPWLAVALRKSTGDSNREGPTYWLRRFQFRPDW
ncbi:MAG: hypothetical protein ACRDD1_12515, partial [Planctomycetia bacterium]